MINKKMVKNMVMLSIVTGLITSSIPLYSNNLSKVVLAETEEKIEKQEPVEVLETQESVEKQEPVEVLETQENVENQVKESPKVVAKVKAPESIVVSLNFDVKTKDDLVVFAGSGALARGMYGHDIDDSIAPTIISNNIDITKPGIYEVVYRFTLTDGNYVDIAYDYDLYIPVSIINLMPRTFMFNQTKDNSWLDDIDFELPLKKDNILKYFIEEGGRGAYTQVRNADGSETYIDDTDKIKIEEVLYDAATGIGEQKEDYNKINFTDNDVFIKNGLYRLKLSVTNDFNMTTTWYLDFNISFTFLVTVNHVDAEGNQLTHPGKWGVNPYHPVTIFTPVDFLIKQGYTADNYTLPFDDNNYKPREITMVYKKKDSLVTENVEKPEEKPEVKPELPEEIIPEEIPESPEVTPEIPEVTPEVTPEAPEIVEESIEEQDTLHKTGQLNEGISLPELSMFYILISLLVMGYFLFLA